MAGAGVFGGYHADKYAGAEGVVLAALFDLDADRAESAAEARRTFGTDSYDAFLDRVDVVTIATPASTHAGLAEQALEAGKHVLVEKPIALNLSAADRLISLADRKGLVLQVGHQERYVAEAFGLFERGRPAHVRSRRLNRFSGRAMDVSVVFDLMIHDLDLLAVLADSDEAAVETVSAGATHGVHADAVDVSLRFPSGMTAQMSASRTEEMPLRDLTLTYDDGDVGLDFLSRTTANTTHTPLASTFGADGGVTLVPRALADPLAEGTERFLNAVRTGAAPTVGGRAGRRALALALAVEAAANATLKEPQS